MNAAAKESHRQYMRERYREDPGLREEAKAYSNEYRKTLARDYHKKLLEKRRKKALRTGICVRCLRRNAQFPSHYCRKCLMKNAELRTQSSGKLVTYKKLCACPLRRLHRNKSHYFLGKNAYQNWCVRCSNKHRNKTKKSED